MGGPRPARSILGVLGQFGPFGPHSGSQTVNPSTHVRWLLGGPPCLWLDLCFLVFTSTCPSEVLCAGKEAQERRVSSENADWRCLGRGTRLQVQQGHAQQ